MVVDGKYVICPSCGRRYYHLSSCPVLQLIKDFEKLLFENGPENIKVSIIKASERDRSMQQDSK